MTAPDNTTRRQRLARLIAATGMDWTDWAALVGLCFVGAGAWITWDLGVALLVVGAAIVVMVAVIVLRSTAKPTNGR